MPSAPVVLVEDTDVLVAMIGHRYVEQPGGALVAGECSAPVNDKCCFGAKLRRECALGQDVDAVEDSPELRAAERARVDVGGNRLRSRERTTKVKLRRARPG